MKKILALFLAVFCTFSFAACGSKTDEKDKEVQTKEENSSSDNRELALETVEKFFDAFMEQDIEAMEQYLDAPSKIPDELKNMNIESLMDTIPAELEPYKDRYEELARTILAKATDKMSYKIVDGKKDGGSYVFNVSLEYPSDDGNVFEETFSDENMNEALNKLIADGLLNERTTQDEMMNLIFDEIIKMADDVEIKSTVYDLEVFVKKSNGKWLIETEKSNLE